MCKEFSYKFVLIKKVENIPLPGGLEPPTFRLTAELTTHYILYFCRSLVKAAKQNKVIDSVCIKCFYYKNFTFYRQYLCQHQSLIQLH